MGDPRLIDLGYDREAPEPERRPGRGRRWLSAAAVVALAGGTVGGSLGPARPALAEVFAAPVGRQGDFRVHGDALYVLRVGAGGVGVAAYDLADGAGRWETAAPGEVATADDVDLTVDGGTVAVVTSREDPRGTRTWGYDAGTGAPLWSWAGRPVPGGGADRMLLSRPAPCAAGCVEPPSVRGQDVLAVDRRTGGVRWTARIGLGTAYAADGGRFATADTDGRLAVRDVATGAVTGPLFLAPMPRERLLVFVAGILLVQVLDGLAGYDPATLSLLWTVPVPLSRGGLAWPCVRLLCTSSPAGTYGIEPATGTVRWSLAGWMALGHLDGRHVMTHSSGGDQIERGFGADVEVIDAASGERLFGLYGAEPMAVLTGTPFVLVHRWRDTGSLVWLGELRADQRTVRAVGAVPDVGAHCAAVRRFLVCRTVDDVVRVWRITSSPG